VLTQVLAASTYPLEVVEAARWSREHPDMRGEDPVDAVDRMDWDPSVKALVAFPDLLARMDSDLQWTQDLGDAFLSGEGEVMDRVQYLRDRADESGHLNSVEHVRVVREREYIYIEPEAAEVLYVPYYDPLVVYGSWWWPAYPPHRWVWWAGHPAGYYATYGTFYWGVGFRVAPSFYFCAFNWPRRQVVVVNHYDVHNNYYYGHSPQRYEGSSRWQHAPEHRHGVAYRSPAQNQQWHRGYSRPAPQQRDDHRERDDHPQASQPRSRGEWTVNRAERQERQDRQERAEHSVPRQPGRQESNAQHWNFTAREPEVRATREERRDSHSPASERPHGVERSAPREQDSGRQAERPAREERPAPQREQRAAPQREERQPQRQEQAAQRDDRPHGRRRERD
jgi:hypothetical protein